MIELPHVAAARSQQDRSEDDGERRVQRHSRLHGRVDVTDLDLALDPERLHALRRWNEYRLAVRVEELEAQGVRLAPAISRDLQVDRDRGGHRAGPRDRPSAAADVELVADCAREVREHERRNLHLPTSFRITRFGAREAAELQLGTRLLLEPDGLDRTQKTCK